MPRSLPLSAALVLCLLTALAPAAAANVPAPVIKRNTVRIPSAGNMANGTLTTKVTYTHTHASAASSTGNSIGLARGYQFKLRTCVAYHLHATTPVPSCAERAVDTRWNIGPVYTYAPSVTLSGRPRPTTQPWGYLKAYVEVLYLNAGTWAMSAHSWPDDGLQGAGIGVAAQNRTVGTLPANSTATFDSPFTGAVNSGQPDSICTEQPAAADGSSLPAAVSTSHAAFAGAPAYYEVGLPTGAYAGTAPLGVMLVIHGGGWTITSTGAVQSMRSRADRWRARGWETVNLSYRGCGSSVADVLWFYDRARAWYGAGARICSLGLSAGGHLALLVAAQRPDLYCAVSEAGPTDLRRIRDEVAYNPATGIADQTIGGRWVHNLGAAAFGAENLDAFSPAAQVSPTLTRTRVLQGFPADDATVPYGQAIDLADAMRAADPAAYVDSVQLAGGSIPFGHGHVSQAALDDFHAREAQLVAPVSEATVPLAAR